MSDKLMLGLGDIDEVSEDEQYEEELKRPRADAADRRYELRRKWLDFKTGLNLKRKRKRRKKAGT